MPNASRLLPSCWPATRRRALQVGALGLTGLTLADALRANELGANTSSLIAPRAKACLLIFLDGGPSHIDLFDQKTEAPAEIRGPYRPIASSAPGVTVGELLPRVAQQMHRLVQIRSVRHEEGVHDPAVRIKIGRTDAARDQPTIRGTHIAIISRC